MTLREYLGYTTNWRGVDNKMEGGGYDFMIFIFLLLPETVNTLRLLSELMCFL